MFVVCGEALMDVFATADTGRPKVEAAAEHLTALNPHLTVETHPVWLGEANARAVISGYDLVLDGTDDFATRFAVSDACLAEGKTLVSGALGRWTGQVGVFQGSPATAAWCPRSRPTPRPAPWSGWWGRLRGWSAR